MILKLFCSETYPKKNSVHRLRGAIVARLTPDQKVVYSSHVGVSCSLFPTLNWSWLQWIAVALCRKKAASATALNLLLNAVSSQSGRHFCVCKSSQYE